MYVFLFNQTRIKELKTACVYRLQRTRATASVLTVFAFVIINLPSLVF